MVLKEIQPKLVDFEALTLEADVAGTVEERCSKLKAALAKLTQINTTISGCNADVIDTACMISAITVSLNKLMDAVETESSGENALTIASLNAATEVMAEASTCVSLGTSIPVWQGELAAKLRAMQKNKKAVLFQDCCNKFGADKDAGGVCEANIKDVTEAFNALGGVALDSHSKVALTRVLDSFAEYYLGDAPAPAVVSLVIAVEPKLKT